MRFEACAVVTAYPVEFPRVKNACIKWAWKMPTKRQWFQVPPTIKERLDRSGKYSMYRLMVEIEGAMLYLSNCASAVVENVQKRTCWIGEVDVGLMVKVFAAPQVHQGVNRLLQENEVRQRCAQFIAAKLLELVELHAAADAVLPQYPQRLFASNFFRVAQ